MTYVIDQAAGENWISYCGDSAEVLRGVPDQSIDFSCYSPPFGALKTSEWCGKILAWQHARTAQPTSSRTVETRGDSARWPARQRGSANRSQSLAIGCIRSTWLRGWERRRSLTSSTVTRNASGNGCGMKAFRPDRADQTSARDSRPANQRLGLAIHTLRQPKRPSGRQGWLMDGCHTSKTAFTISRGSVAPTRRIGRAASPLNDRPSTQHQSGPMPSRQYGNAMAASVVDAVSIQQPLTTVAVLFTSITSSASTRARS